MKGNSTEPEPLRFENLAVDFYLSLLIICVIQLSCTPSNYERDQMSWRSDRLSELSEAYAWPSVVGLYPLNKSITYFGSSESNEILLQAPAPSSFGSLHLDGDSVVMHSYKNLGVQIDGQQVSSSRLLSDMDEGGPTKASYKSLQWYVIKRQDKYFLRVKDSLSTYRRNLTNIPYYEINENYRVKAKFTPADSSKKMSYQNVLGMNFTVSYAGQLEFNLNGKDYSLLALPNGDERYFVIFSDLTAGEETYGGGRYIYPQLADANGETWIDFNKAINPPCVFTPYATCPLPPRENKMDLPIEAGEKYLKLF